MSGIEALSSFLDRIAQAVTAILLASILVIMSVQVFFRYILNFSFFWSEELVRYLFFWTAFLGGATAFKRGDHLVADILINYLKGPMRKIILFAADFVIMTTLIVLLYYGAKLTLAVMPSASIALNISMAIPYGIIPIGSLLMLIHHLAYIYRRIRL